MVPAELNMVGSTLPPALAAKPVIFDVGREKIAGSGVVFYTYMSLAVFLYGDFQE